MLVGRLMRRCRMLGMVRRWWLVVLGCVGFRRWRLRRWLRVFEERMEWRRREDLRGEFKRVERGWCLGGEEFRQELLEQVDARPGPSHFGEAVQEAEGAQAERLVVEGLKRLRWAEADLRARRKGERGKVQLARELRSKTTMPLAWIAARLNIKGSV